MQLNSNNIYPCSWSSARSLINSVELVTVCGSCIQFCRRITIANHSWLRNLANLFNVDSDNILRWLIRNKVRMLSIRNTKTDISHLVEWTSRRLIIREMLSILTSFRLWYTELSSRQSLSSLTFCGNLFVCTLRITYYPYSFRPESKHSQQSAAALSIGNFNRRDICCKIICIMDDKSFFIR